MNEEKNKQWLIEWIDKNKEEFCKASIAIWNKPELAMQEHFAVSTLTELLEKNGFRVTRNAAGMPTAFVAEYGEGSPVIGFSAEFDALPGLSQKNDSNFHDPIKEGAPGHGCGHSLLAVGGVQAATALKNFMEENNIKGTIKLFGTPAEEICVGKPFMAKAGLFEGLDAVVDWHPGSTNTSGYRDCLAYFNVKYHFKGKASHGNAPWRGVSALDSAMLMGHAIEIMREHVDPGTEAAPTTINYAFPDCGNAYPVVVPDRSDIWIVGRFNNAALLKDVQERVRKAAEGCALATGTTVEEEFITATHNMIPNKTIAEAIYENFRIVGAPDYSEKDQEDAKEIQKAMGCDATGYDGKLDPVKPGSQPVTDASEYSWFAPLGFLNVALSPSVECSGHNWTVCRMAGSETGMKVVVTASKVLALTAYDLMTDPELLKKAQEENKERLHGQTYESMIPDGVEPDLDTNKDIMEKFND